MIHNSKGRTAQKLEKVNPDNSNIKSPDYRVYNDYTDPSTADGNHKCGWKDGGHQVWRNAVQGFEVRPDYIEEAFYEFSESSLNLLNNPVFIRDKVQASHD